MNTVFTKYLLDQGWYEDAPMSYKKEATDLEIFFDTSSQIEIYKNRKRIRSLYLTELTHLVHALKDVMGDTK